MEQRQPRLGDILDDYCPRERRVTNHAVVAMVGADVKQTRCTTCDAEHEYKHARVPRQRRKAGSPAALYAQAAAGAPKRVTHDPTDAGVPVADTAGSNGSEPAPSSAASAAAAGPDETAGGGELAAQGEALDEVKEGQDRGREEGPVHRPLIRASLPRPEGQPPPARPIPEFTIRQPGGRASRFRPRHQRGQSFHGDRSNGAGGSFTGQRRGVGPPLRSVMSRPARHQGPGRKRSK